LEPAKVKASPGARGRPCRRRRLSRWVAATGVGGTRQETPAHSQAARSPGRVFAGVGVPGTRDVASCGSGVGGAPLTDCHRFGPCSLKQCAFLGAPLRIRRYAGAPCRVIEPEAATPLPEGHRCGAARGGEKKHRRPPGWRILKKKMGSLLAWPCLGPKSRRPTRVSTPGPRQGLTMESPWRRLSRIREGGQLPVVSGHNGTISDHCKAPYEPRYGQNADPGSVRPSRPDPCTVSSLLLGATGAAPKAHQGL